jgi:phenylacetate-CoA ligase
MPGIDWPVVPAARAALVLGMLYQLEQSQWWPAEVMARHQFRQLDTLVAHAAATVPFYGPRLREMGWSEGRPLTAEQWRRLPVLRRSALQEAGDAVVSNAIPADHGRRFTLMTSGSTGRPVQTVGTALTQLFWSALTVRDHVWHGRDFSRKLGVIRQFTLAQAPPEQGASAANWGSATDGTFRTGPAAALDIDRTVREQAAWLAREQPGYLLTYPSNVVALARHFSEQGLDLPGLLEVRTFGEVLEPRARDACRAAWGVPLVDMYSSQEVGYIALQCPGHDTYHVQSENLLVEIVDDEGQPCRPGDVGRVVVTTLHNFATPLLRYELGDFAEVGAACPCGRGLPVLTRVLGRQRNMLTLPDGDQRWPNIRDPSEFASAGGPALPPLQQFQVIQRSLTSLEVLLVCPRALGADEEDVMRGYLAATLGHVFDVTFTYVAEVPRSKGGKFEDFRSELRTDVTP